MAAAFWIRMKPSDWIELYNPTDRSVHLGGCYLSDDLNNLTKWPFPADTWLEPGGFLLVWASGKDQTGPELHTSFKIDHEGEQIILTHRDRETIIDYFYVSPVKMDISWGRQPDGGSTIVMFGRNQASPGESNNTGLAYLQPNPGLNPSFSHQGGFYEKPFMLTLDPAAGTTVYFTLDGSIPDPLTIPTELMSIPIRSSFARRNTGCGDGYSHFRRCDSQAALNPLGIQL